MAIATRHELLPKNASTAPTLGFRKGQGPFAGVQGAAPPRAGYGAQRPQAVCCPPQTPAEQNPLGGARGAAPASSLLPPNKIMTPAEVVKILEATHGDDQ